MDIRAGKTPMKKRKLEGGGPTLFPSFYLSFRSTLDAIAKGVLSGRRKNAIRIPEESVPQEVSEDIVIIQNQYISRVVSRVGKTF